MPFLKSLVNLDPFLNEMFFGKTQGCASATLSCNLHILHYETFSCFLNQKSHLKDKI